jgi:hypothetical protein
MIVLTRIPTHRNDGSKVSERELRAIMKRVFKALYGYSLEGPFQGGWRAGDGESYEEMSYRLEVVVNPEQVQEARELFMDIGKRLGQRAIYFEVRKGGEIIDIEEDN